MQHTHCVQSPLPSNRRPSYSKSNHTIIKNKLQKMNQWYTRDSDGCGQFKQKNNVLHLWHLNKELLVKCEERANWTLNNKKTSSQQFIRKKKSQKDWTKIQWKQTECRKYKKTVHKVRKTKGIVSYFISLKSIKRLFQWWETNRCLAAKGLWSF